MNYREEKPYADSFKQEYLDGIEAVIKEREKYADEQRKNYIKDFFDNQEEKREDLKRMLGWPLYGYEDARPPEVTKEELSKEDGFTIYRMTFEVLKGLKLCGLYFEADTLQKVPLVIVQHGGSGTPELISGVYGYTSNYNDMLHRVRKHGVHVFAPQLLLWNQEDYKVTYDRKEIDARLKRTGSSVTAIEVYGIIRILDYFESLDIVSSFGMVGLSYGGFYSLYTAAIDKRIKAALSCSFFAKRYSVGWSDWTWHESSFKFDDAETACLVYPRKLYLAMGDKDELFDSNNSVESYEKIKEICKTKDTKWVDLKIFDGNHEFIKDDEQIEKLIRNLMTSKED